MAVPVVGAALGAGRVPGLSGWRVLRREVPVGRHRLDLLLQRAAACRAAVFSGVFLRAYTCRVTPRGIALLYRVPGRLGGREPRGSRSGPSTFWP